MTYPVLYSFRRCPYAMRARLAIVSAGITCELREVLLRDKAPEMLTASAKGTVPVVVADHAVIDESLDIMLWALGQNDPEGWLADKETALTLIADCDGPFKTALDRYKYAARYDGTDPVAERTKATVFLNHLNALLNGQDYLFGPTPTLADMGVVTFVRQFAFVDKPWFDVQPWQNLSRWLEAFLVSPRFIAIMNKHPKWEKGDPVTLFP